MELSIVLVIIGLLIGGILAAQSMISTSKIQNGIKQLSQYDALIANFHTKYLQLPGDTNLFPQPGNNDNQISDAGIPVEPYTVWYHLSLGTDLKTVKGVNYTYIVNGYNSQLNCPIFNMEQNPVVTACIYLYYNTGLKKHYYFYYQPVNGQFGNGHYNAFLPKTVLAMEQKLDDGNALTGRIRSDTSNDAGAPTVTCATAGAYNAYGTEYSCRTSFELGIINGFGN